MKIQDKKLFEHLHQFRRVSPRAEFLRESRSLILNSPRAARIAPVSSSLFLSMGARVHRGAMTFIRVGSFITAGAAVILISFYATKELSPVILPGLNAQRITAEAEMLDSAMNIELANLGYFDINSQKNAGVLQQLSQKQPDHLNDTIIKSEVKSLNTAIPSSTDLQTNNLNKIIEQMSK